VIELKQSGQQDMVATITGAVESIIETKADLQQEQRDSMSTAIETALSRAVYAVGASVSSAVAGIQVAANQKIADATMRISSLLSQLVAAGSEAKESIQCNVAYQQSISFYNDLTAQYFLDGDQIDCLCLQEAAQYIGDICLANCPCGESRCSNLGLEGPGCPYKYPCACASEFGWLDKDESIQNQWSTESGDRPNYLAYRCRRLNQARRQLLYSQSTAATLAQTVGDTLDATFLSHCYYRAAAKFGTGTDSSFDTEDDSAAAFYGGTSSYWVDSADPGGNVAFYFERVQELQTLHWLFSTSQSYWDKQDSSHNCDAENMPYEPEQFYKYHYQILLPYLAPGTAWYDGYPFATGCVDCVTEDRDKLPRVAAATAAAAAAAIIIVKRKDESPSPPPWAHQACYNTCGDGNCASLGAAFSCEQLSLFGCDCDGCCTAGSPPPRPPAPPPPPPPPPDAACGTLCGAGDCESMGASFTCAELEVFGCSCSGCCHV